MSMGRARAWWMPASIAVAVAMLVSPSLDAAITRNAGKYGTMIGWMVQGLPPWNLYAPTIDWDAHNQSWWNEIVRQAQVAGFGWLAADAWGQRIIDDTILRGDPAELLPLLTAIDTNGGTMKVALFDDTTSEVLRKNFARGHGSGLSPKFDLADQDGTGEGGYAYFYDQQWKRFFQTIPDRYRLKINDRPVIFMWLYTPDWYEHPEHFHTMIDTLRGWTKRDFGFDPFVIPEGSWLLADPAFVPDASYEWFNPPVFATLKQYNGIRIGHAVPGYDCHLCIPPAPGPIIDRQSGRTYRAALDAVAPGSDLVLVEGLVNAEENALLLETPTWHSLYLDITRWYVTNIP
jgi:Domain of unknown function (DUF5010)